MHYSVIALALIFFSGCSSLQKTADSSETGPSTDARQSYASAEDDTQPRSAASTSDTDESARAASKQQKTSSVLGKDAKKTMLPSQGAIDKTEAAALFRPMDRPPQQQSALDPAVNKTLPFKIEDYINQVFNTTQGLKANLSHHTDYSEYGFITPTDSLENLINNELQSLRHSNEPKSNATDPMLFDRIRRGFSLDLTIDNPRIASQLNWYAGNQNYLDRTFSRASRYLHYIVDQLEKHGMPLELALLPLVESAYDPFAYSHGRASGLWQFIPGTGKMYGLHQNWWYDGRRDVIASTQAAIDYLTYLNKRFDGNWLHALAAYNSGSGRVSQAIRKNKKKGKPTDFWSLHLPRETRAYVPKLIAIAKIVSNPEHYGVSLKAITDKPYFEIVDIRSQLDLAQAATMAEVDIQEIYRLNPGLNQWATPPLGPHTLLVPATNAKVFKQHIADLSDKERLTWQRYTVKPGDSLIKIAKRFNTTPSVIKEVNHLRSTMIRARQKLLIPIASKGKQFYGLSETNRLESKQARIKGPKGSIRVEHIVQTGDTMWDLALAHKVGVRALAKWNGMAPTDVLKPGKQLVIWSKAELSDKLSSAVSRPPFSQKRNMIKQVGYRVRKGDSLARIASRFSVRIQDLINWNNLDKHKYLQPGQKLTIFVDITNS